MDIFERVRVQLEMGKDFAPEVVKDLCQAYDARIAELEGNLTMRAADGSVRCEKPYYYVTSMQGGCQVYLPRRR